MKNNIHFLYLLGFLFCLSCSEEKAPIFIFPEPEEEFKDGISLSPESLDASKEATITFKASKTSELYNYTGDVYVHIGIAEGHDWVYVPTVWDKNEAKNKMTQTADNTWSFSLTPSIREWFGAGEGVIIQRIAIVFRSADGTKKGISEDSFIPVSDDTFTPREPEKAALPAGIREGINIINASTATFVLYEKDKAGNRKDYAYLIGDFNDWKLDNKYRMKRDDTAGCWWYTLTGLEGGTKEYAFQYYVGSKADGAIRLADAYCEKVLDPSNDSDIPASTYPNLREYPTGKTTGIASVFQTVPQTYNWRVKDFAAPPKDQLVIYEMLLRDFTVSGDINGAMEKLDYLKALGFTAVELMPVQEFDRNDSWGYNPCFYFATDKAYGTKEMYKQFIDACHERGMAVILDVVYNHATGAHPFARLYWDATNNLTASNNPWFNVTEPHPYSVFHDFNHETDLVRTFVKRNLEFLLTEYKIDGFRFDLTKGFTQKNSTESTASNYDASRIEILKDYNAAIKAVKPEAYVIFEHFCDLTEENELAKEGIMLWRNMNNAYSQSAMGYNESSSFEGLYYSTSMPEGSLIGYMESHDEERMGYKQITYGSGKLKTDVPVRMKQLASNAAFFFTVPGPKMVWQFGEMGYDVSIDENGRTGKKPTRWEYLEDADRKDLHDTYSKLINLRLKNPQLFATQSAFFWNVGVNNWENGRFLTLEAIDGKRLMAVVNFTSEEIRYEMPFEDIASSWYDLDGSGINVTSATQSISIPPHEFRLYMNFNPR